jgi:hypothetical protein
MAIGAIARSHGDRVEAEHALIAASAQYRAVGDDAGVARAVVSRAWNAIYRGEYRQANDLFEQAIDPVRSTGDKRLLATLLAGQSVGWAAVEEYVLGVSAAEESLRLWRDIGDLGSISQVLGYLGYYWLWQGYVYRAEQFGIECLALAQELGMELIIFANELLGYVALERGEYLEASSLFRSSIAMSQEQLAIMQLAESLEGLAGAAGGRGDPERGAVLLGAADAVRERYGSPIPPPRQDRYQRTMYSVQSRLDESVFQRAWTQGRSMSTDQAVEYSLTPDPAPEHHTRIEDRETETGG